MTAQPTNWRGRSGRFYALSPLPLDAFLLQDNALYLLASGRHVLWVGTAAEVIAEAASRAHFRLALAAADNAFCIALPVGDIDRMTMAWDLEAAEPVLGLSLT